MGNSESGKFFVNYCLGHYYSLISDENKNWYEFNDTLVKQFNVADLAEEAFGGEDKSTS